MKLNKYFRPSLLGGIVLGLLSSIPYINTCNIICLWVIFGGGVASFLYWEKKKEISLREGLISGGFAGALGAPVSTAFFIIRWLLFKDKMTQKVISFLKDYESIPLGTKETIIGLIKNSPTLIFINNLFFNIIIYSIFAGVGGLITVKIIENLDSIRPNKK